MFCPKCGTSIGIDFRDCLEPHTYGISVSSTVSIITFPPWSDGVGGGGGGDGFRPRPQNTWRIPRGYCVGLSALSYALSQSLAHMSVLCLVPRRFESSSGCSHRLASVPITQCRRKGAVEDQGCHHPFSPRTRDSRLLPL